MQNWTIEEMKRLFSLADAAEKEGKGLKTVFDTVANETGRKPNSVRNYYYAQLKTLSLLPDYSKKLGLKIERRGKEPFTMFDGDEIKSLVRDILIRQGAGESVRAITTDMAQGDKSKMLRFQNKYRSMVFNHRNYVHNIMQELSNEGMTFYNPYTKRAVINGKRDPSEQTAAADKVNTLLRKFFAAESERDKIQSLSDYMSELSKLLISVK